MNRGFAVKYILILGGKLVKRKVLAFLLSAAMVILVLPAMVLAFEFSDMPDDWSKTALESAVENGLLTGADGKLMPRDNLTRAQMAAVINRAFGATGKASLNGYTDVAPGAWYYDDMAKAVQMKTLLGSGDKLNPDSNITREEAFVVLARAFKLTGSPETILDMFSDKSEINSWSEDGIASLVSAGYITGSNGRLYPKQNITRAEFAQIMYNLLKHYIKTLGTYSRIPEGNIMINAPDITLKDVTVKGDLIIGDGAGDGNIILDNVKVTGRTVVRGGGPDSIKIIGGSELGSVIISKVDGNIRVVTESGAAVEVIYIDDGKDDVIIEGEIDSVKVDAANVPVVLQNAVVTSMTVTAPDASITIESNATVDMVSVWQAASDVDLYIDGTVTTVTTEADGTLIDGGGTVVNASIQGDDCSLNTAGTKVEVGESISGTTIGSQTVDSGTTGITDSKGELVIPATGGRRSSGSSRVNINAISIDGEARVGITLSTTVTPTNATVNYQWQRADAEDGVYTDISGATSATFTPIGDNVDKYLKVSATGTGSYTGTVTSEPAGAVLEAQYASTEAVDFDVTVPYGTSEENTISELAPAVGIAGTEGEAGTASIQWTIAGYDENTADDYTATGGLSLPDGWTGSPADVTATVTVQAQELAAINSIAGTPEIGELLTAGALAPEGATSTYQWQYHDGSGWSDIEGATANIYTVAVPVTVGDEVRVTAEGTGNYTGTLESNAVTIVATQVTGIGAIAGTPELGEELTAGALTPEGATVTYQWQRQAGGEGSWTDIEGATVGTYTVAEPVGAGDEVRVAAEGTGNYTGILESNAVTIVATQVTGIGAIEGTPKMGEELTAGALTPEEATVTYQWQRQAGGEGSWTDIEGATTDTYTVAEPVGAGDEVRVAAEGTGNYTGTLESNAVTIVATQVSGIGEIDGTPEMGEELTAGALTPEGAAVAYQWQYNGGSGWSDIEESTANTYTVAAPVTIGDDIRVIAEGTGNYTGTVQSTGVTITAQVTGIGEIDGTPEVGEELTAGALTPAGATVTYKWQYHNGSGWSDIEGATANTYTVAAPAAIGDDIRVVAEGTGNYTGTVQSTAVTITAQVTGIGSIAGTPEMGEELTAGTLTPEGATVTYKWQYNDGSGWSDIAGATANTYTVAAPVTVGNEVRVAAEGTGNYTGTLESNAVTIAVTQVTGIGAIDGTPKMGEELTAGALTPEGATATYQWQYNDGSGWADIAGATANTYTVASPAAIGDEVRVVAEGTGNYTGTVQSAAVTITATQVTGITVTGEGGSITVVTPGGTLQMVAVVEPENATDDSVTWSVSEFYDGLASIDQTGLLTLTGHEYGTVYVTATANDGSGEEGTLAVNVVYAKSIGQEGPAGGIVFYDKGDYIDGWRYLEAADPSTIAQGEPWKNTTTAWSNVNSTLVGTSTDVGSGQANTNLILNQGGHTASAAKIASEHWSYTDESYDDWFLPSLDELNLIFSVLFDDELVTFNPMHTYWSSSEIDLDEAYGKAYASQEYLWYYKSDQYLYVWPIRAF